MILLIAAVINWLTTTIFVESKLFLPVRNWFFHEGWYCVWEGKRYKCGGRHMFTFPEGTTEEEAAAAPPLFGGPWAKVTQLVTCQLCVRTWVGFAEAFYFGGPCRGWAAPVANGLLYAGLGHLIYSLEATIHSVTRHNLFRAGDLPLNDADKLGS